MKKMTKIKRVIVNSSEPEYFEGSQPEIVRYEIARPERKGTLERLQETIIENTVNQYELDKIPVLQPVDPVVDPLVLYSVYGQYFLFRHA